MTQETKNRDDRAFIEDPDNWPQWPLLPMKRIDSNQRLECAFIVSGDSGVKLYRGNIFAIYERPGNTLAEKLTDVPIYKYESVDALLADGWVID